VLLVLCNRGSTKKQRRWLRRRKPKSPRNLQSKRHRRSNLRLGERAFYQSFPAIANNPQARPEERGGKESRVKQHVKDVRSDRVEVACLPPWSGCPNRIGPANSASKLGQTLRCRFQHRSRPNDRDRSIILVLAIGCEFAVHFR